MATDIEKHNLEAHVELCAERYDNLENKLIVVEKKVEKIEEHIVAIRDSLADANDKQTKQILAICVTIMGALITAVVTLIINFVNK